MAVHITHWFSDYRANGGLLDQIIVVPLCRAGEPNDGIRLKLSPTKSCEFGPRLFDRNPGRERIACLSRRFFGK
jgi:hypothetical protein